MDKQFPPKIYGLIGHPVKHSFSPAMHNAAFKHLGINAEYRLFEVKPEELEDFLLEDTTVKDIEGKKISTKVILGFNVTIPHKERVLEFIKFEPESFYLRQVRAVNTIKKEDVWKGFNTDISGFLTHLKENFNPKDKKVALLGAGGAARAVTYALAKSGVNEITVFDIDKNKSENVTDMIKGLFPNFQIYAVDSIEQLDIKNKDLLVNATPVGLKDTDPCLVSEGMLHKGLFVYDLIYNPPETKLLALAKNFGAKTSNGLGMLLYQGMHSFRIWMDKNPPQEIMMQALQEELKRCQK